MGKKLLQLVLALAVIGLGFYLYVLISTPIKFGEEQKVREKAVITRIKDIRTAERQFKSKYQHFTADFDSLINFVLNETMEGERKIVDEDDSVAMARLKRLKKKNVEKLTSDDISVEINVSALNMSRASSQMLPANVTVGNTEIKNCWVYGDYTAYVTVMSEEEAATAANS